MTEPEHLLRHAAARKKAELQIFGHRRAVSGFPKMDVIRLENATEDPVLGSVGTETETTLLSDKDVYVRQLTTEEKAVGNFLPQDRIAVFYDYQLPDNEVILRIDSFDYIVSSNEYNSSLDKSVIAIRPKSLEGY